MKNAHLRFGHLTYIKVFKKSTTRFRLPLDRFVGEAEHDSQVKVHFISVIRLRHTDCRLKRCGCKPGLLHGGSRSLYGKCAKLGGAAAGE